MVSLYPSPAAGYECLLHDPAISDLELAQVLVETYYPDLYRLALPLTSSPELAKQAALTALTAAVSGRHTYWDDTRLRAWLYTCTLDAARSHSPSAEPEEEPQPAVEWATKFDSLPSAQRLALILCCAHLLPDDEIASILNLDTAQLQTTLYEARSSLSLPTSTLAHELSARWSSPSLDATDRQALARQIENLASARRLHRSRSIWMLKVAFLAAVVFIGLFLFFAGEFLLPQEAALAPETTVQVVVVQITSTP